MRPRDRVRIETGFRALVFLAGCALVGATSYHLGLAPRGALVLAAIGAVLAAVSTSLPWGGFFFPSDALVLSTCLIFMRFEAAGVGLGAALASASILKSWRRTVGVAAVRNVGASLAAVAVWRALVPSSANTPAAFAAWVYSLRAVPPLVLATVTFLAVGSGFELLVRRRRGFNIRKFLELNLWRNFHHLIFTLLVGAIVSVAYVHLGVPAFVLFAFPLLLTRDALKRSLDLRRSRVEALRALSSSVDARDRYTYDHSSRVSRLSAMLAREMGSSEAMVEAIESGALLHDIGKIGVDVEILSKPGPLDADEQAAIRQHPLRSAQVVGKVELFKGAVGIVRHHHERPDGKGYPDGLKADEIPLGARILNVADAFDAMTSDRPYRKKRSIGEAVAELKKGSGSEFDPVVVEYLVRLLKKRSQEIADLCA